jgi:putative sugar O-methyltransferase
MHAHTQVAENPALLQAMLEDLQNAPEVFRPTNYWAVYERRFLPELQRHGLRDFRRRPRSVLASFGATDLKPRGAYVDLKQSRLLGNRLTQHLPGWSRLLGAMSALLSRPGYAPVSIDLYDCSVADLQHTAYHFVKLFGEHVGARPLDAFECSLVGNPEDVFEIEGRTYTMRGLYYYLRYAYCCQFVDFDRITLLVELGSGSGKQIEVIRKLHPHICILAFDIAPQLYVCEQFLSAVFPSSIVSYAQTRTFTEREIKECARSSSGKIFIFGTGKFPLIASTTVDLFWNAVSFQEMEPDVVANYLQYVNQSAEAVFLQQRMEGKKIAPKRDEPGVLRPTTLDDYRRGLSAFDLVDLSPCLRPLGTLREHYDSFWRRRRDPAPLVPGA